MPMAPREIAKAPGNFPYRTKDGKAKVEWEIIPLISSFLSSSKTLQLVLFSSCVFLPMEDYLAALNLIDYFKMCLTCPNYPRTLWEAICSQSPR